MVLYVLCGIAMAYLFAGCEHMAKGLAARIPAVLCETLCGVVLGAVITFFPAVAFSGEEQMGAMTDAYASYGALALMGIGLLKLVMTTFCIQMGMKGGHFFPLIFACVCMGFGVGMLVFGYDVAHLVFAAGTVTAACLGAQMKKPLAVALLCLLCFPAKMIFFLFLAAAIGGALTSRGK